MRVSPAYIPIYDSAEIIHAVFEKNWNKHVKARFTPGLNSRISGTSPESVLRHGIL